MHPNTAAWANETPPQRSVFQPLPQFLHGIFSFSAAAAAFLSVSAPLWRSTYSEQRQQRPVHEDKCIQTKKVQNMENRIQSTKDREGVRNVGFSEQFDGSIDYLLELRPNSIPFLSMRQTTPLLTCSSSSAVPNVTVSNNCVVVFEDGFVKPRGAYDDEDFATQLKLRDRTVSLKLGEVVVEIRLKKWDVS
ncbi:hypothetical protein SLEP1_g42211 [Rubroshorea leprosula]|uniref:Uncharacterized protein n=1 Tax=Rubroshorea leprosula TaxID=152421 RepID=A0AAV5LAF6_9ROSI|nr:hypothetical protein SLEP1_g42211 [Rubroshorea leprosula]